MTATVHRGDAAAVLAALEAGSVASSYDAFLRDKEQFGAMDGFTPTYLPGFLYDFQTALVDWAVRKGKAAIFADCGLGKTPMQLVWAQNVVEHTNKPVLILTPLAVSSQTLREAEKFGIWVWRAVDGTLSKGINITNYERLHLFNPSDFSGVVCDESSILKSFDGVRRAAITEFMRTVPYRLLCTATAAPNDYTELGTSSEALGHLGHMDMLTRFFVNSQHSVSTHRFWGEGTEWRFKPHAEEPFWRWVCSWARAIRKPSDLGFDDARFVLPSLVVQNTVVKARVPRIGMLFDIAAVGLKEEREVKRRTITERCEIAATKVAKTGSPAVMWCHLNDEGNLLAKLLPGAIQVSGNDADEAKEAKFTAFQSGQARVIIIKPKIGAFGLNWQHCAHIVYFPSHSYEQYYQAVRRCWRFGQTRPVVVDLVLTDGDERVLANLQRKSEAADKMFTDLVRHMSQAAAIDRDRIYSKEVKTPSWL